MLGALALKKRWQAMPRNEGAARAGRLPNLVMGSETHGEGRGAGCYRLVWLSPWRPLGVRAGGWQRGSGSGQGWVGGSGWMWESAGACGPSSCQPARQRLLPRGPEPRPRWFDPAQCAGRSSAATSMCRPQPRALAARCFPAPCCPHPVLRPCCAWPHIMVESSLRAPKMLSLCREERYVYAEEGRYVATPELMKPLIDENTIGVVGAH